MFINAWDFSRGTKSHLVAYPVLSWTQALLASYLLVRCAALSRHTGHNLSTALAIFTIISLMIWPSDLCVTPQITVRDNGCLFGFRQVLLSFSLQCYNVNIIIWKISLFEEIIDGRYVKIFFCNIAVCFFIGLLFIFPDCSTRPRWKTRY